jgi:DNA polymerase-3 subunit delta'
VVLDEVVEQEEAKALLAAALRDGPAHAYLFHGPAGVGKRTAALAFAAALLGDGERVLRLSHPDLYLLEPQGDQIRIDDIRALRRDLHLRPFEAERRVYLIASAQRLNREAADALLKDLEEPPAYAVFVLLAEEVASLPETIRSRCQPIPFRRLSTGAVRRQVAVWAPDLAPEEHAAIARVAGGRLDVARRLATSREAAAARTSLLALARAVYSDPDFDPAEAASRLLQLATAEVERALAGERRRLRLAAETGGWAPSRREEEQHLRRLARGVERETLLEGLAGLAAWYRDLLCVALGAEAVVVHLDHLGQLRQDARPERLAGAERAIELVQDTWRSLAALNLQPRLALEALFLRLRRELAGRAVSVAP